MSYRPFEKPLSVSIGSSLRFLKFLFFAAFLLVLSCEKVSAGGWYVGNTAGGEWIAYKEVWLTAGDYRFTARVASPADGSRIRAEVDSSTVKAGVSVPNTGGPDKFTYVHLGTKSISEGYHELKVVFETANVSLDWFMIVKDTDTTGNIKGSDKTMIYPPTNGMIVAPVVAFHRSESDGHPSTMLNLGEPWIKDANGNPFNDDQVKAWWSIPMYRDWDRRTDRYWDITVDQLTALRAQMPYFYCKSTVDFTNDLQDRDYRIAGGAFEGRWLKKFVEAVARNPQAASSVKIGMIWDQGGLGNDFQKVYGYYPSYLTPALVDYAIDAYLAPWLDEVPASMLYQPQAGRPVIRVGNILPGGVINEGAFGPFLQELRNRLKLRYGIDPLFITQHDGTLDAAAQAQVWGRVRGMEWSGPLLTQNSYNGSTWCCTSVGRRHGLDQVWLNNWNPVTNTGTPGGNSAGNAAHQPRLDGSGNSNFRTTLSQARAANAKVVENEGLHNLAEGNSTFRSYHPEWKFPNQHMAAMRQYADPDSQTLMFEAEGCDTYQNNNGAGNRGGTYRQQWYSNTNLDVYRSLHNALPWNAKNSGPGNLVSIEAGFYDVWALDSAGVLWAHRIVGSPDVWTRVTSAAPQAFSMVSVGKSYVWGVSTNGTVYSTHLANPAPYYENQGWTSRGGSMAHVSVGDREVWGTDTSGNVFRRPLDGSGNWTAVGGQQLDKVWVGDAHVWGIRGSTLYHGLIATPPATNATTFASVPNPNNLTQLDVGSDEVWGINAGGTVYRMSAAAVGSWEQVSGTSLTKISVGENYAWGLNGSTPQTCKLEGFRLSEAVAPIGIRATTGNGQTTLEWIPTPGATSYNIKRATSSGGPWTTVGTSGSATFTNGGLSNGTTYYYIIEAVTAAGNAGSAQFTVVPSGVPATPGNLSASTPTFGQINLNWTDNANNDAGVIIERRQGSTSWGLHKYIYASNVTSYNDNTVLSGTSYSYRVRAYNSNRTESSNSNEVSATSQGGSTIYVNFQPITSDRVPGYLVDGGQTYALHTDSNRTYGWSVSSNGETRERGVNSDQRLDTVLLWKAGAKWEISVPNGTYTVKVSIGDSQDNTTSTINVEGVNYWNNQAMTPGLFLNATKTVNVSDGRITMDQGSLGGNATRVNYVEIATGGSPPPPPPGSAPTGLTATPGNGQVALNWNATSGASGYTVKRSTDTTSTPAVIGTTGSTSYTDTGRSNGTVYYYTVSATISGTETVNAALVGAMPGVLSSPWATQNIGGSAGGGAHASTSSNFSILAKGSDIWNASDQFRYIYQPASGDCSIQANVTSVQNVDAWTKMGVMIRETLAADSSNVAALVTPGNGVGMQWRSSTGASTANSMSGGLSAPYWVKVTRVGNVFTAYRSTDGSTWTQSGNPQTITMGSSCYVGLVATSHNSNLWASGTINNVTAITSGGQPPSTKKLVPGTVVSLKANANGQYVSADNGGANPLIANKTAVGTAEKFTVVDAGGGKIGLRAMVNNKIVVADNAGANPLIANRDSVGAWESFTEIDAGSGKIALLANANGKYVCADNGGANPLIANRTSYGGWETYTVEVQ